MPVHRPSTPPAVVPVKPKPTNLASISHVELAASTGKAARQKNGEPSAEADKAAKAEASTRDKAGATKDKLANAKDECAEAVGSRAGRGSRRHATESSARCAAGGTKTREAEARTKAKDEASASADEECDTPVKGRGRGRTAKPSAKCAATDGKTREADAKAKAKDKASASAEQECDTAVKGRGRARGGRPSAKCAALAAKDEKDAKAKSGAKGSAKDEDKPAAKDAGAGGERYWVQVASGANKANLGKAWDQVKSSSRLLAGKTPSTSPWRGSNRILVGPFKNDEEAQDFVNKLGKQGVSGIQFTSRKGVKVEKLPSN